MDGVNGPDECGQQGNRMGQATELQPEERQVHGACFIDIDPDDGDEIRGLASHRGDLFVFKGPYVGSIHRISGDTPLSGVTVFGSSLSPTPFSKTIFVRGLGAAGHNSIFRWKDDLGFIDGRTASANAMCTIIIVIVVGMLLAMRLITGKAGLKGMGAT